MRAAYIALLAAGSFTAGAVTARMALSGPGHAADGGPEVTVRTVIRHDTVTVIKPHAASEASTGRRATVRVARAAVSPAPAPRENAATEDAGSDSIDVSLPVTQTIYEGDGYRAWVSGHAAALDSLRLMRRSASVEIHTPAPGRTRRWHLGLSAGYGMTPEGLRPMAGVTLTYSLLSW